MITFYIDTLTPCLKSVETGDLYDTESVRVKRKSVLSKYNKKTGWYVNWSKFDENTEIYALVIKGTNDIQGLIAVRNNDADQALDLLWACVSPENNVWEYGKKKFEGVGGHLFAIATDISLERGYEGFLVGEAMDKDLYEYYMKEYGALPLPAIHNNPYRIMFPPSGTLKIKEVYTYDETDDII